MREIAHQLSIALRSLSRQPGIMLPAVITLALGIGSNMALFAYLSAMLWPTLDVPDPERVVNIYSGTTQESRLIASYPEYLDIIRLQHAVVDVAGNSRFGASISDGDRSFFGWSALISGNYFPFFAAHPALGRLVQPADDQPGAPPVAVLSHRFWKGSLGGDPAVVGRELRVNGINLTVIGVAQPGFQGAGQASALYIPVRLADLLTATPRLENREARMMTAFGRLAPGMTEERAQAAFDLLGRSLDASAPLADGKARKMAVFPYGRYDPAFDADGYVDRARTLMAVATAFLLLGCASIANLLLARAISKHREWGIRASLGASRGRLLSGVIAESFVLCVVGGLAALPIAVVLGQRIESFVTTPPGGLGDWSEGTRLLQYDARTAAFAALLTLLCALLGALGPVMRIFKGDLLDPLKSDASGVSAGRGGRGGGLAPRKILVVLQVALSMLLLLSGGLLVRTLKSALNVDPGFPVDGLALVTVNIPRNVMTGADGGAAIYERVLDEARRTPGVSSASLTHVVPASTVTRTLLASSEDRRDEEIEIGFTSVAPDYFQTLGIPIVAGRALDQRDGEDAPRAAVVSQTLAKRLWGERPALGRMLRLSDLAAPEVAERPFEVVGVARDTRTTSLLEPPGPLVYLSYEQRKHPRMTLVVRATAPFATLAPALRRSVQQAHPDLSILDLVSGRDHMARGLVEQRMYAEIAGLFALLGLAVAVVGLFGLMSYSVSLRGRELGIRMAIGARPVDVERLVLRQGMTLVLVGVTVGLAGAMGLSRFLSGMIHGVAVTDPVTFLSVPAVLAAVSLLACWFPARRAARLNPTVTLKSA
jgi:putative ABC transport system permease protein